MIKNNLHLLMAEKKIRSINKLAIESGVSAPALHRLYDGSNTRIDYSTLESLCRFFNCDVGDILKYEEEGK